MKVAIVTTGRFHVLDLARELEANGHEVYFWTYLPRRRTAEFGLSERAHRGLLALVWPLVVAERLAPRRWRWVATSWLLALVDALVASRLEPCDVLIGMSGVAVRSAEVARTRYGAKVIIERGSRHVLSQKRILEELGRRSPGTEQVRPYAIERHTRSLNTADLVAIPAVHVADSFREEGVPEEKLFLNPYGTDLEMFSPTRTPQSRFPVVIYVGQWSYQKGVDTLVEAVRQFGGRVQLLHVGPLADAPLPSEDWFQHHEPVPQRELREMYGRAHVFALPSRQDGLALVQVQALACGLPVVCSSRTGGEDIAHLCGVEDQVFVVPPDSAQAVGVALGAAIEKSQAQFPAGVMRDFLHDRRAALSWKAYGRRYSAKLWDLAERPMRAAGARDASQRVVE